MVDRPASYPWSSFSCNALGKENSLIKAHELYLALGLNAAEQCKAYRGLFADQIKPKELEAIREATNKSWVLGSGKFRDKVEALTARQAQPKDKGGDRKSKQYCKNNRINRV